MVVEQGSEGAGNAGGDGGASGGGTPGADGGAAAAAGGAGNAPAASPPAGDPAADPEAAALAAAAAAAAAKPAFTPNFKYTVRRQEREIPEWARGIVKDADTEKSLRDVFERADGLDEVKQHRDVLVNENQQMRETWGPLVQENVLAKHLLETKNYGALFQFLGVPTTELLTYAYALVQARENPILAAQLTQNASTGLQAAQLHAGQQFAQATSLQQQIQAANTEIDNYLAHPQVSSVVQAFDARMGKPGSFRAELIRRGQVYQAQGQGISVADNLGEMLRMLGVNLGGETPNPAPSPAPAQVPPGDASAAGGGTPAASAGGAKKEPLPTLPNIKSRGGSPAKKVPTSLDGMRQRAKELAAAGR